MAEQITSFLGLRENQSGDITLKVGELAKCTNCRITDNLKIRIRDGYDEIFETGNGGAIRGMWYGKVAGEETFIFARDGKIYTGSITGGTPTEIGTLTDSRAFFFGFSDKVYMLNGNEYLVWDGTGSFASVSDTAYIPLVAINTPPAGGGTAYDEINVLTGKKHQQFDGDGVTATYQLAETGLDSVDSVEVDGIEKVEGVDYTVNLVHGTVLPTTPADFTNGTNNIDIYWTNYLSNSTSFFVVSVDVVDITATMTKRSGTNYQKSLTGTVLATGIKG